MLRAARPAFRASFVRGRAESLPFPVASFQLVTIGCAYHWCDRERLFAETNRVLLQDGWLAIFDSEFAGLVESPALLEWLRNDYWPHLPWCPHNSLFDPTSHLQPPFSLTARVSIEARVPMTADAALLFITTQASTINAVTSGAAGLLDLEERLREGLYSHFPECRRATARFVNRLWLLRKDGRAGCSTSRAS
jgi:SAM-dependent methyltransferase